jgi:hypothetical protein
MGTSCHTIVFPDVTDIRVTVESIVRLRNDYSFSRFAHNKARVRDGW